MSGYSSARRDSTTDSEFETTRKGNFFSDDGLCVTESDDEIKNMRDLIDQKVFLEFLSEFL